MLLNEVLLLVGIVIMICILLGHFAENLPIPSLLIFIGLGMFFGVNGPIGIQFDDYSVSENICTICLVFIMFYGGFGTNITSARPVLSKSICLSTLGVLFTAGFTGTFIHFIILPKVCEFFTFYNNIIENIYVSNKRIICIIFIF